MVFNNILQNIKVRNMNVDFMTQFIININIIICVKINFLNQ